MEFQSWSPTNILPSSRTSSSSSSTTTTTDTNNYNNSSPDSSFSLNNINISSSPPKIISYLAILGNNFLYAASLNHISVFDLNNNYTLSDTFACNDTSSGLIKSISFTVESKRIYILTTHQDSKIRVWQQVITTATKLSLFSIKHRLISTLPTLKHRLWRSISAKNYVQVRRHKQKLWIQHADAVSGLALAKMGNGVVMYSISWDRSFKTWKFMTSESSSTSSVAACCTESVNNAHSDAINAIVVVVCHLNNNNITVYTASADGTIKVWEKSGGGGDRKKKKKKKKEQHRLLTTLDEHNSRSVNALVFNKEESVLFSGGSDANIVAWETAGRSNGVLIGGNRTRLSGHGGAILCLTYQNDSLISGSSDRTVRIWKKAEDGCGYCCVTVLEGHSKPVKSLATAATSAGGGNFWDKRTILSIFSGGLDGEIKVWKVDVTNFNNRKNENEKEKKIYILVN